MKHVKENRSKNEGLYDSRNEHDSCGLGFIANIKGMKSHEIIKKGLFILENLEHRGATGADPLVGDGAGILTQIPHEFFVKATEKEVFSLPDSGDYGVGFFFFPKNVEKRKKIEELIDKESKKLGISILGWRTVPVDNSCLSKDHEILESEPVHIQAFFTKPRGLDNDSFERALYILRKSATNSV